MYRIIKNAMSLILTLAFAITGASCGKGDEGPNVSSSEYKNSLELLSAIWEEFDENKKFPSGGGDEDNLNMNAPGEYSVEDAEALDYALGFPASLAGKIDSAASLVHAMNQNTFTCGVYHFKADGDAKKAVSEIRKNILARQWVCGFPDSLVIISAPDNYVISLWGIDNGTGIITEFISAVNDAVDGAEVIADEPIV